MTASTVPYDPDLERETVGSLLAGYLDAIPAGVLYDHRNERLRIAAETITGRHYDVRGGRPVLVLDGLELDPEDRGVAEMLATGACVATSRDVDQLADLAFRRRLLVGLLDAVDAVREGSDIDVALAALGSAA